MNKQATTVIVTLLVFLLPIFGQEKTRSFSLKEFRNLRWLTGSWQLLSPEGEPFYERIRFKNDSTISIVEYRDSKMRTAVGSSTFRLESGNIFYYELACEWKITRFEPTIIEFIPIDGDYPQFSWKFISKEQCVYTMYSKKPDGERISRVFPMQKVTK